MQGNARQEHCLAFDATPGHAQQLAKALLERARDPEMRHPCKGEQYFFGMKAHIGVDAESGLVHTVITTPANTADVMEAVHLLHGDERAAYADAGYQGVEKRVGRPGPA
jgi:IS5 family transposase